MSYSAQIPGSLHFTKYEFPENQMPSAGTAVQQSCYSYIDKISGLTNPVSLQHDVMYANAFAAIIDRNDLCENDTPLALGCVGHRIDKAFPLESKTQMPLPLLISPTKTDGNKLDEVDMCAKPVLNWESYINDLKTPQGSLTLARNNYDGRSHLTSETEPQQTQDFDLDTILEEPLESTSTSLAVTKRSRTDPLEVPVNNDDEDEEDEILEQSDYEMDDETSAVPANSLCNTNSNLKDNKKDEALKCKKRTKNLILAEKLEQTSPSKQVESEHSNLMKLAKFKTPATKPKNGETSNSSKGDQPEKDKLTYLLYRKLKHQPKLRIEGTWNNLYGGFAGACCFMKTGGSRNLNLFLGKGSQLRSVKLDNASSSSIFSYKVDAIWEEDDLPVKLPECASRDPFDELIFQLVPNEYYQLLGVRRGRSIQIYSTEDEVPLLLESIPNLFYGTKDYFDKFDSQKKYLSQNPLLCGFDFNPTFGPEIITIDENGVVRICDFNQRSTSDLFIIPNARPHEHRPKDYPIFSVNAASGVTFTNHGELFYAWKDSVVYLGDRRPAKYSRANVIPLFDVRSHAHSLALSSQNHFHDVDTQLNEYVSCVRRSKREHYYYVGTTSKLYLMDHRVPSHPVIVVNHGLQSALTYMESVSSKDESFEIIIAGSQRLSETVCMISDFVHLECLKRPGCKGRNPLLHCYPKHLLNPRQYFDTVVDENHDFSFPVDYELIKNHFYAWPTGLATYPLISKDDGKSPRGFVVANVNNFGDVFWQEWDQVPLPSHRKISLSDYKFKMFLSEWYKAMKTCTQADEKPRPSSNVRTPVDCTIFLEPFAKEIENISRIRDSPYDCFKPNEVQKQASLNALIPMEEMFDKIAKYKNHAVKGILDVWRDKNVPENVNLEVEQVEIKVEPPEDLLSVSGTINLDTDEEASQTQEHTVLTQVERVVQYALNPSESGFDFEEGINLNFSQMQSDPWMSQQSENYPEMFQNSLSLDFDNDIDSQPVYSTSQSQPSSSKQALAKKSRKSGFL